MHSPEGRVPQGEACARQKVSTKSAQSGVHTRVNKERFDTRYAFQSCPAPLRTSSHLIYPHILIYSHFKTDKPAQMIRYAVHIAAENDDFNQLVDYGSSRYVRG